MSRIVVFTDLDDTLFQTAEKCRTWSAPANWTPAALDGAGQPRSFQVPAQRALLELLRDCPLIPVTGRNRAALERVIYPKFTHYRIVSHGGMVYDPDGNVCADWLAWVAPQARAGATELTALTTALAARLAPDYPDVCVRLVEDAGLPMYVSLKLPASVAAPSIEEWRALAPSSDWYPHVNGNNMALLPPYVRKATAVAWVIARERRLHEDICFVALGDSDSDLGFMHLCDFAAIPRHAQIRATWPC